jgi:hypothetical protein
MLMPSSGFIVHPGYAKGERVPKLNVKGCGSKPPSVVFFQGVPKQPMATPSLLEASRGGREAAGKSWGKISMLMDFALEVVFKVIRCGRRALKAYPSECCGRGF